MSYAVSRGPTIASSLPHDPGAVRPVPLHATQAGSVDDTLSNAFDRFPKREGRRRQPFLWVLFCANQPSQPASRHSLSEIDCVMFGRGERRAIRETTGGLRRLCLRLPDPMMSVDHGRLLFAHGTSLLQDERSKNGRSSPACPPVAPRWPRARYSSWGTHSFSSTSANRRPWGYSTSPAPSCLPGHSPPCTLGSQTSWSSSAASPPAASPCW